jgi:hypothetical protein
MSRVLVSITCCMMMVGFVVSSSSAEQYQALALQSKALYGESIEASEDDKNHYLSRGQEYLREYFREQMIREIGVAWLAMDVQNMQTGVAVDLNSFYQGIEIPLHTQMRVYADEDLNNYLNCGRFLPVEIEMDSTYSISSKFKIKAKVEAPFDDVMRFQLGSQIDWTNVLNASIQYQLSNASDVYDGVSMGIGWHVRNWRWRVNYEITAEYEQIQHISLASDF